MFLHTFHPTPILAHFGPLTIHWYGALLSLGALAGFFVFRSLGRRAGIQTAVLESIFFWSVLAGLVGARLYHVLNEFGYYRLHPEEIVRIWNGGLAIHGAILAGLIALVVLARHYRVSAWILTDCAAPALVLGQAIGRWGNYFNQELFGRPTNLPWGIPIDPLNRPLEYLSSSYFHPTFLYESLGALAVFFLLVVLFGRLLRLEAAARLRLAGLVTLTYLVVESLIRLGTETLRVDRVPHVFGVRLPLLVSGLIAALAAALLWQRIRSRKPAA